MNGRPEYAMDFTTFNRAMAEGASAEYAHALALQSLPTARPAPRGRPIVRRMALALALAGAVAIGAVGATVIQQEAPTQAQVEEDSTGWDCRTMGNRDCGPVRESE